MRPDDRNASPRPRFKPFAQPPALVVSAFAVGIIATFFVYRPDQNVPFDFVDFSEFLPLLRGESFFIRFQALFDYYAREQGRASVLAYAVLAAKWGWFGDYSPAWQWMRFGTMWVVATFSYILLRRIGFRRVPSLVGASVFLFAPPAVDGWTRLTMAEPLGTVLMLCASVVAIQESDSRQDERRVWLEFFAISLAVVLLKEMLAATLLLPVALALVIPKSQQAYVVRSRIRTLATAAIAATFLAGLPVAIVALSAKADAYVADFGTSLRPISDVIAEWTLGITPFSVGTSFPPSLAGIALLLLIVILVAGWVAKLRMPDADVRADKRLLAVALLFPLIGAATYLPWPSYNRFYAIPFLFGGAMLAAGAFTGLAFISRLTAPASIAAWSLFMVFAAADAAGQWSRLVVRQRINREVVVRLSALRSSADTVFLGTEQQPPSFWQGIGPTLQRYGEALGYPMPRMLNASCEETLRLATARSATVLFYGSLCKDVIKGDSLITRYRRLRLPSLRPVTDSIRVDIVVPSRVAKPAGTASN